MKLNSADLLGCPFCGGIPERDYRMDSEPQSNGSYGHYAIMRGCCRVMGLGRTELFFSKKPERELWENMCKDVDRDWNFRSA